MILGVVLLPFIVLYAAAPAIERRLTFQPSRTEPWPLPPDTSDVFFTAADGVRLHGRFTTAQAPRTGLTVLHFHGNGGTVRDLAGDADLLHKRGFDVLLAEYRGYGRSEGEVRDEQTLDRDGAAAFTYLTRERGVDPVSIVLVGHSLGTTVAAHLATKGPCHAVLLLAPLASARLQAQSMPLLNWLPGLFFERMANRFDTVGKIASAHCPVMVVHGDHDDTINVAQGRAVYAAAQPPKRLIIVPGGGHWLSISTQPAEADEMIAFLRQPAPR